MPQFIHPLGGFELEVFPWPDRSDAQNQVFNMEGWEWYSVFAVDMIINNTGGAVSANGQVFTQWGGVNVTRMISGTGVGAGATLNLFWGLQSVAGSVAGVLTTSAIPWNVQPQGATLNIGFTGGDAGTRLNKGSVVVIGKKFRSREHK